MPGKIIDLPTVAGPGERAPYTPIGGDDRALHTNLTIQRFFFFFHFFFFFFFRNLASFFLSFSISLILGTSDDASRSVRTAGRIANYANVALNSAPGHTAAN